MLDLPHNNIIFIETIVPVIWIVPNAMAWKQLGLGLCIVTLAKRIWGLSNLFLQKSLLILKQQLSFSPFIDLTRPIRQM